MQGRRGRCTSWSLSVSPTGAHVPIPSYTCTEPNLPGFNDQGRCTVSGGLRTCEITEGSGPNSNIGGLYIWNGNTNPFVVLDIPQGWCVGSVKMTFRARGSIPTLSLSVHSAERLSTNTDRTVFSLVSEEGTTPVVMNLTALACGKYFRINMTSTVRLYLQEIEVFGTSRYTVTDNRDLHDMLTPLSTSLNLSSVSDDSICTHPFSAGGDPASPTTSVGSSTYPVTPFREYTCYCEYISVQCRTFPLQAQVTTQPPLVPSQHHPHHPVLPPVVSQLPLTAMSYLLPFPQQQCYLW